MRRNRSIERRSLIIDGSCQVIQCERLHPQELLARGIPVEVHLETRLCRRPATVAARPDADVLDDHPSPFQDRRVIGVVEIVVAEPLPIGGVHAKADLVDNRIVEQVIVCGCRSG
jgi:hypothetical protein